jgi:hypothetical protein
MDKPARLIEHNTSSMATTQNFLSNPNLEKFESIDEIMKQAKLASENSIKPFSPTSQKSEKLN